MNAPDHLIRYGIDAGGTRTRLCVRAGDGTRRSIGFASVNPASVGRSAATANLALVFQAVGEAAAGQPAAGWFGSASVRAENLAAEKAVVTQVATGSNVRGVLALTNDAVPLLLGPPLNGAGAVAIIGTGSGFIGGDGTGNIVRVGGYEYLASDEGSAFDLGLNGLRAACQALDGRRPPSGLTAAFRHALGGDLPAAARRLAELSRPKQAVAALAPVVCEQWLAGDSAATEIVQAAIAGCLTAIGAIRGQLGLPVDAGTVLVGGVINGCPPFADAIADGLRHRFGAHPVHVLTDAAGAALSLADRLTPHTQLAGRWNAELVDWIRLPGPEETPR